MSAPSPQLRRTSNKRTFANFPLPILVTFLNQGHLAPELAFNRVGELAWGDAVQRKGPQSFLVAPGSQGARGENPFPCKPSLGSRLQPPFPLWSFPGDAARLYEGEEIGSDFRGLCGLTKLILVPSSPGTSGQLQRAVLFCGEGRRKRVEERVHLFLQLPGGVGGENPPSGALRFLLVPRTLLGLEHP